MYFVQRYKPWLPRRRRAGDVLRLLPQRSSVFHVRHKLLGARASFRPPSSLLRPSSSTRLTANVQTVASVISLLNDYLLSTDRPPLGWLNPWLYDELRTGFKDIQHGSNPGCGTEGFSAVVGWDPVRPARLISSFPTLADCELLRSRVLGHPTLISCRNYLTIWRSRAY